jgi:hypothetical protein
MNALPSSPTSPRALLSRAWNLSPALTLGTGVMLLGGLVTALALAVDSRQLLGESVWLKPLKFYVSLVVYDATLLCFLAFLPERRRLGRAVGAVVSLCGVLEMAAITLQAARGVRSHFNIATPFDQAVFASMGLVITTLWVTIAVLAVAMLRAKLPERPLASALRLGLVVALVGMGLGFFMTGPHEAAQREALATGHGPREAGGHTFGGTDGGPGLPWVGWSTTAGDMRPAHFVGLHGLQVLPLLALLLGRRGRSEAHTLAGVRAAGVGYLGLTVALAVQALRGQPVVQWDGPGMTSLALVLGASLATWAASLPRRGALSGTAA